VVRILVSVDDLETIVAEVVLFLVKVIEVLHHIEELTAMAQT
jgi:hypothetical protein